MQVSPVFGVRHDFVSHSMFAAVLEAMQELDVRDVLVGRLYAAARHELSKVVLLQSQTKVCQNLKEVIMAYLEHTQQGLWLDV